MRCNPVCATLSIATIGALGLLPFVRVAPNRLVSGEAVALIDSMRGPWWLVVPMVAALPLLSFAPPARHVLRAQVLLAAALIVALVAMAGAHAQGVASGLSTIARTSLGGAFWVALVLLGLLAADGLQRLNAAIPEKLLVLAAVLAPVAVMLASGWCDQLSLMKEYSNRSDLFATAIARHVQIVAIAMLPTLLLGVPLGWLAYRSEAARRLVFPVLNIVQTLPSIALFGLLMAPLALLAAALPALARAGISGVGLAPGVIALVLYSLLPVVRGTLAGLEQVPTDVIRAARGMGMTPAEILRKVEVPLAMPVLLTGIRTASIQAIGLAAITALIGAGGLGSIMFEGLFASAQDLVLLGVLPIVVLAVLVDAAFKVLIGLTRGVQP